MKQSKQQDQSQSKQQSQAQTKQQSQTSQSKQQKQSSLQSSMDQYGTMTARQDANADYDQTSSNKAAFDKKAQKYADQADQNTLS